MNKKQVRHQLIRSLISETTIQTQQELLDALAKDGVHVTQATLSRDIKELHLVKVTTNNVTHYAIHHVSYEHWEKRLRVLMEDSLIMLRTVNNQVIIKTLPGLANSFGYVIDEISIPEALATICGNDVCLIICEDEMAANSCFEQLKQFAPPLFFSKKH